MPESIHCIKCSATGTKSARGFNVTYPDGWMMFEGLTSNALNREVWICDKCASDVHERPSMLALVDR